MKQTTPFVRDAVPGFSPFTSSLQPGVVCAANPAVGPGRKGHQAVRSSSNQVTDDQGAVRSADNEVGLTTLDLPLTQYAVGYPGEGNLQAILDVLAPVVPAADSFQYLVLNDKQNWVDLLTNDGDIRALGGEFGKLPFGMDQQDGSVDEKGLTVRVDHRLGGQLPAVRQAQVARLKNILLRTELRRVFATLDANVSAESSENWGPSNANRDPDGTILGLVDASGDKRGINPNLVVFGGGASLKRKKCYRALKQAGSTLDYLSRPEDMAAEYEVGQVINFNLRRQAGAAKAKMVTDVVYGYYAGGLTAEDPSNLKRFTNMSAGNAFQVYVKEEARWTEITVWHASRIICTSNIGIFKQPVSYT